MTWLKSHFWLVAELGQSTNKATIFIECPLCVRYLIFDLHKSEESDNLPYFNIGLAPKKIWVCFATQWCSRHLPRIREMQRFTQPQNVQLRIWTKANAFSVLWIYLHGLIFWPFWATVALVRFYSLEHVCHDTSIKSSSPYSTVTAEIWRSLTQTQAFSVIRTWDKALDKFYRHTVITHCHVNCLSLDFFLFCTCKNWIN